MHEVYISLGSNMGDKQSHINQAVSLLDAHVSVSQVRLSSLYASAPIGYLEQDDFINAVVEIKTTLRSKDVLLLCQSIEQQLYRKRIKRWGPRTIDLDILLYDDQRVSKPELEVPHPRMHERAFALLPLLELAPDVRLNGVAASKFLENVQDQSIQRLS